MAGSQRLFHGFDARVSPPHVSARAVRGELRLRAEAAGLAGRTVLAHRHAAGAFHLSKPYWDGHALMVQWINPTAGIFAGDMLESDVAVGPEAALLLTTPSATRIHTRINPDALPGEQRQHFHVASGGHLEVQPEWLIPQRGSAFVQRTTVDVEDGASLFFAEILAPGRVAHQESLAFAELDLRLRLRVAGQLVVQERLRASAPDSLWMLRARDGAALFCGTVLIVMPGAADQALASARACLDVQSACMCGITSLGAGALAVRLAARQGLALRQTLKALRVALAPHCGPLRCELRKL